MNLRSLESNTAELGELVELLDMALPAEAPLALEVVPLAVLPLPVVADWRVVSVEEVPLAPLPVVADGRVASAPPGWPDVAAGGDAVVVPPEAVPGVWAAALSAQPKESKATARVDFRGVGFDMIDSF